MAAMASKQRIEDPETIYALNRIGSRKLSHAGALLHVWENKTKEGLSLTFPEWVMKEEFIETTKRDIGALQKDLAKMREEDIVALKKEVAETREEDIVALKKEVAETRDEDIAVLLKEVAKTSEGDMVALKNEVEEARERDIAAVVSELTKLRNEDTVALQKELAETREELAESKKNIDRLLDVHRELNQKYDEVVQMMNPPVAPPPIVTPVPSPTSTCILSIKTALSTFNKENPVAVASGDASGVDFDGHTKISCVDSLVAFLRTERARELGVPSDILVTFKAFVFDGKLVTLSKDYHNGVGYSFLWTKTKSLKGASKGWRSAEAAKYDPRLGTDPLTGEKYVDPETGVAWVFPGSDNSTKKRSGDELSSPQDQKKAMVESPGRGGEEGEVFI